MINTLNGEIEFDSPAIRFSRHMTLQQFRAGSFFSSFKLSADLDPSFTYCCEATQADGRTFDISVRFFEGVLNRLTLSIHPSSLEEGDYVHRNYLREVLGYRPEGEWGTVAYEYEWGQISAGEAKGQESDIRIVYAA